MKRINIFVAKIRTKPILILLFLGLTLYLNSLFNNFVWEDWGTVVDNPLIKSIFNIPAFFRGGMYFEEGKTNLVGDLYRPLMFVYFTFLTNIFGTNAFVFHLIQVLFHLTNASLVFLLLRKFFNQKIAFWLSLIFLVHPINTETVSYISNSNEILSFLFGMLGFIFIKKNWLMSGIFLLLSIFSKESGILFLVITVLYSFLFDKQGIRTFFANLAVLTIYILVRINLAPLQLAGKSFFPMERLSFIERILNVPDIILFYLKTYIFPVHLSVARQWVVRDISFNEFLLPLLILLTVVFSLIFVFRNIIKTIDQKRIFLFFCFWLIIGLVPYLQFIPLNMTVGERWFYFAQIGLLGMFGLILGKILKYKYVTYILLIIILIFSFRTFWRNFSWKDDYSLFTHDVLISPESYMVQTGAGMAYFEKGIYDKSEYHFLRAIRQFPDSEVSWINLGSLYEKKKDFNQAIYYFKNSLDKNPTQIAYERISTLQIVLNNLDEAEKTIQLGLQIYPKSAELHFNNGLMSYKYNHDLGKAVSEIEEAINISNDNKYQDVLKKIKNKEEINIEY